MKQARILFILFIFFLSLIPLNLSAGDANYFSKNSDEYQRVKNFMDDNINTIIQIIKSHNTNEEKSATLKSEFFSIIDVDWIAKFVVSRHYNAMTALQKEEYKKCYRKYLSNFYVKRFIEYNGHDITIEEIRKLKQKQYMAVTMITDLASNQKHKIVYIIKENSNKLIIRDIIAENISLIITQRGDFHSILSSKGGIDKLIHSLKGKTK